MQRWRDQSISDCMTATLHPYDRGPRYLRMLLLEVCRNEPRCFADRLDQMSDGQSQNLVGIKRGAIFAGEMRLDAPSAIDHMSDIPEIILRHTPAPPWSGQCLSAND